MMSSCRPPSISLLGLDYIINKYIKNNLTRYIMPCSIHFSNLLSIDMMNLEVHLAEDDGGTSTEDLTL